MSGFTILWRQICYEEQVSILTFDLMIYMSPDGVSDENEELCSVNGGHFSSLGSKRMRWSRYSPVSPQGITVLYNYSTCHMLQSGLFTHGFTAFRLAWWQLGLQSGPAEERVDREGAQEWTQGHSYKCSWTQSPL